MGGGNTGCRASALSANKSMAGMDPLATPLERDQIKHVSCYCGKKLFNPDQNYELPKLMSRAETFGYVVAPLPVPYADLVVTKGAWKLLEKIQGTAFVPSELVEKEKLPRDNVYSVLSALYMQGIMYPAEAFKSLERTND